MGFFDIFKPQESEFTKMNNEIYEAVTKEFNEAGYIKQELLPQIFEKIQKGLQEGIGFTNVFSYNDCVTLKEKKSFGYPTMKKISREMINSLTQKGQKLQDPKGTIENLYYKNYSPIRKRYELIEMKRRLTNDSYLLGYQIIASLDYNTCIICGAYDGKIIKTVAELDAFENRKCNKDECGGCSYTPVEKGLGSVMHTDMTYAGWFRKLPADEKK